MGLGLIMGKKHMPEMTFLKVAGLTSYLAQVCRFTLAITIIQFTWVFMTSSVLDQSFSLLGDPVSTTQVKISRAGGKLPYKHLVL